MATSPAAGGIPASPALSEASPFSLGDVMSADPEGEVFRQGLPRMVAALRAQQEAFVKQEAEGAKPPPAKRAKPAASTVADPELDF